MTLLFNSKEALKEIHYSAFTYNGCIKIKSIFDSFQEHKQFCKGNGQYMEAINISNLLQFWVIWFLVLWRNPQYREKNHIENSNLLSENFRVYYLKTKWLWRVFTSGFLLLLSLRAFQRAWVFILLHATPGRNASFPPLTGTIIHVIVIHVLCVSLTGL